MSPNTSPPVVRSEGPEPGVDESAHFSTAAWAGAASRTWLANADRLEAMLEPVSRPLFAGAALAAGQAVLDVGCGRGESTREAARRVGRSGRVVGIDVSTDLISAASAIPLEPSEAAIEWIAADAQREDLGELAVDVMISRFGVMFFDDAVDAFVNLRRAVRPGGRLAVAVWQPQDASPFQVRALRVAVATAKEHGYTLTLPDPTAGPFAFGVPSYVADTLTNAGWAHVAFDAQVLRLHIGGPGASPAEATALGMSQGPLVRLIDGLPADVVAEIGSAVEADLATCWDGVGVAADAAIAVITAISSNVAAGDQR